MAKEKESGELVHLGVKVPAEDKDWLAVEAAQKTIKTGKKVTESDIVREWLASERKKSAKKQAQQEASK